MAEPTDALTPAAALARLVEGNTRFLANRGASPAQSWDAQRGAGPQRPFAVILACADSRVPVEILFDQGFGDLFVVRVAGNVVAPSLVGSVEYAVGQLGTPLVVVMGHSHCGAVTAAVEALQRGDGPESENLRAITDRIGPHIAGLVKPGATLDEVLPEAVRANVRASVDHLGHGSRLLEDQVLAGKLAVVGAVYELETGEVHLLDRVPDA